MAGSSYERILAAEWLTVMGVQTLDALSGADTGKFSLPDPAKYFATFVVYLMLAAAAMFGDRPGRLAAAFGGVAGLSILLFSGKNKQPPVLGALNYFDKLLAGGGPKGAKGAGTTNTPGSGFKNVPTSPTIVPGTGTNAPPGTGFGIDLAPQP